MPIGPTDLTQSASHNSVSLVIPLYNEEEVLPLLVSGIESFRAVRTEEIEVLFIDDGSQDRTAAQVRNLTDGLSGYTLVRFSRNFGHQLAVSAGLDLAKTDAAIIMDADLQDPLPVAGQMIDSWKQGYDVVYGIRTQREGSSFLHRWSAKLFYRFFSRFTDVDAPLDAGDFRLLSRRVLEAYSRFGEQQPYVRGLVAWLGFNQIGIEYERPARAAGKSKYPWRRLIRLAFDGIASFSGKPLRYAVRIGLLISGLSFAGLIWVLIVKILGDPSVPGWASIIFVGFFFGGLQLFFLGVVGSYVARVYEEVKARPRYIIKEMYGSTPDREHLNQQEVGIENQPGIDNEADTL